MAQNWEKILTFAVEKCIQKGVLVAYQTALLR
jgi:mannitol/fructose-specific phosphotransferase system IIA component (Ntr-type)